MVNALKESFQARASAWLTACFGKEKAESKSVRIERFAEEAAELCQAGGLSESRMIAIVRGAYAEEKGDIGQEVGGVMLTLSGVCSSAGLDMENESEKELERVAAKIDKIKSKEAVKRALDFGRDEGDVSRGKVLAKASLRASAIFGMTDEEYAGCLGICPEAVEDLRSGHIGLVEGEPAFTHAVELVSLWLRLSEIIPPRLCPSWVRGQNTVLGKAPIEVMTAKGCGVARASLDAYHP